MKTLTEKLDSKIRFFDNFLELVPQGGSQKSKVKSQKYYGMGFLGILNGCSIYAVVYYYHK